MPIVKISIEFSLTIGNNKRYFIYKKTKAMELFHELTITGNLF